jgi:thiamine transport system ATP-binding protein
MIKMNLAFDYPQMPMQFTLEISQGERVAIIGESGAGKSTLLNLIAGFESANRGFLRLNGEDHFQTTPANRPVSMLFQQDNLFLHLTVEQNIGLGITPSLNLTAAQKNAVQEIAEKMGIAHLLPRSASQLSGGQQQRVALARTLLRKKPILLLDEPFSALDPQRRQELQQLVLQVCQQNQLTMLMVTHQFEESQAMFDRVIEIANGHIVRDQRLTPR